jgi:hypothetical protein
MRRWTKWCGGGGRGDLQRKKRRGRSRRSQAKREFREDRQGTRAQRAALRESLRTIFQPGGVQWTNLSGRRPVHRVDPWVPV